MDLDHAFVASCIREGRDAVRTAISRGVDESCLTGSGLAAWKFVLDHLKKYNEVPDLAIITSKTGVTLDTPPPGPAGYFTDEILNRRLHGVIGERLIAIEAHFQAQDPQAAYAEYEDGLRLLRKLGATASKTIRLPSLGPEFLEYYDLLKAGHRGILTPWPTVNDATLGFWPEDFVLYVARLGVGKCISATSVLTDPRTGIQRTIEEIYRYGSEAIVSITSWSPSDGIHVCPIAHKVDTGRKDCLRFVLRTGREIVVTPEHPFLTTDGWQRADTLCPGMSVALPAHMPFPEEPILDSKVEATVLALMLTEGAYSTTRVGFRSKDDRIVELAQIVADRYSVVLKSGGSGYHDFAVLNLGGTNSVLDLLDQHGVRGKTNGEKKIPDRVFRYGPGMLSRFLTILWMCDGCITDSGAEMVLESETMIRQLQSLLLRFGIQSRIALKPTRFMKRGKATRNDWRLRVVASSYSTMLENLGVWGDKQDSLRYLSRKKRNNSIGHPRVSARLRAEITALAQSKAGRREGGLKKVGDRLGWSSYFMTHSLFGKDNTLRINRFKALCEVYEVEDQYKWLWADIYWDTVVDIVSVGEQKVYDLTVTPSSCFVANDILVHNTWALTIIANYVWSIQKRRVLFATTEMARIKIFQRWLAVHYRYTYNDLRRAQLSAFAEQKMRDNLEELQSADGLYIIGGEFDFRIESLEAAIEECEPDVVFMDGAYLLKTDGTGRTEKAANSFDELKRVAKRDHVPLVASTQFNREVTGKIASVGPEKIALTDAAGWNADLIFGLVRTEDMKRDKRMIQLPLKFREGEADEIETWWDFDLMNFDELPKGAQAAVVGPVGGGGGQGPGGGLGGSGAGSGGSAAPDPDPYGTGLLFGSSDSDKDMVPF